MAWQIRIPRSTARELDSLPDQARQDAIDIIAELSEDPFAPGSKRLEGRKNLYRVGFHANRYRIIYQVSVKQHCIVVTRVRRRDEAYRGL